MIFMGFGGNCWCAMAIFTRSYVFETTKGLVSDLAYTKTLVIPAKAGLADFYLPEAAVESDQ